MIKSFVRKIIYSPFYIFASSISFKSFTSSARQVFLIKNSSKGKVTIGDHSTIGNSSSPGFFSYSYLNLRKQSLGISIGSSTSIGNRFSVISEKKVSIGSRCLIGNDVKIFDTDFHSTGKDRKSENSKSKAINLGNNVFIGDNAIILKGIDLGDNCVIGAGSIVTKSFPENTIIAGNPACKVGDVH